MSTEIFCPKCGWKPEQLKWYRSEFRRPPQKCSRCGATLRSKTIVK